MNYKAFVRYLLVAICSAIVTFLSSCSAGLSIGRDTSAVIEHRTTITADSATIKIAHTQQ